MENISSNEVLNLEQKKNEKNKIVCSDNNSNIVVPYKNDGNNPIIIIPTEQLLLSNHNPIRSSLRIPSISSEKTKNATKKLKRKITINRETLPLKITLFLFYGAMASILPYLTIHMKDIGISIKEIAVIYAVLPFTSFLGPPLIGIIADKWGNYKPALILATIGSGFFNTMLLLVPQYHVITTPGHTFFQWDPMTNQGFLLPHSNQFCDAFTQHYSQTINFTLDSLTECQKITQESESILDYNNNNNNNNITIGLLELIENISGVKLKKNEGRDHSENKQLHFKLKNRTHCSILISNPYLIMNEEIIIQNKTNISSIYCKTNLIYNSGDNIIIGHQSTTFWLYFILRILGTTFMSCCFTLLDATTLAVVRMSGTAEYGKERIWCIFGSAITSPIAGIFVDQMSSHLNYTDYSPAFYLSNTLLFLNIIAYFCMKLNIEKPDKGFLKNGYKLFKYPEVVVFLIMIFIMGSLWGFVESYLFVFLKELNAPNYLLGLTLTIGSLTGIPFLWGSEKIVTKIGRVNLLIISFLTYFVRYFGYSYLTNPFWCFPFEAMEAITYHLMWTAAATYCSVLAPKGLLATLMGIMGSLHYSLGKGNGSFIGGYLFGEIGARLTFRWFGVASGIFGIIFFLIDFFWIRKIIGKRLENNDESNIHHNKDEIKKYNDDDSKELKHISGQVITTTNDKVESTTSAIESGVEGTLDMDTELDATKAMLSKDNLQIKV